MSYDWLSHAEYTLPALRVLEIDLTDISSAPFVYKGLARVFMPRLHMLTVHHSATVAKRQNPLIFCSVAPRIQVMCLCTCYLSTLDIEAPCLSLKELHVGLESRGNMNVSLADFPRAFPNVESFSLVYMHGNGARPKTRVRVPDRVMRVETGDFEDRDEYIRSLSACPPPPPPPLSGASSLPPPAHSSQPPPSLHTHFTKLCRLALSVPAARLPRLLSLVAPSAPLTHAALRYGTSSVWLSLS